MLITQFWGDQIAPGSKPVLIFPVVANRVQANDQQNVNLTSTYTGTVHCDTTVESGTDTETGTAIGTIGAIAPNLTGVDGYISDVPVAGQLANLNVKVSLDGKPFVVGAGVLSEIANGYYKYILDSTETQEPATANASDMGAVLIRIYPTNPLAVANFYIHEVAINLRVRPPGIPLVQLSPSQALTLSSVFQPITDDLKNYVNKALRDLLGNQLTDKPTFRKD